MELKFHYPIQKTPPPPPHIFPILSKMKSVQIPVTIFNSYLKAVRTGTLLFPAWDPLFDLTRFLSLP
jgi:hypothetical protein